MTTSHREYLCFAIQCRAEANQTNNMEDKDCWESLARFWIRMALPDKECDSSSPSQLVG